MRKIAFLTGILLAAFCGGQNVLAQQRPSWWNKTEGTIKALPNSDIQLISATAWTKEKAENEASDRIKKHIGDATGSNTRISYSNGKYFIEWNHDFICCAKDIGRHWEKTPDGEYQLYLLVQILKNPTLEYEPVWMSETYPFSARAFIPGMEQIYKGSPKKGYFIIGAEALCVGGIVTSFCMKSSYEKLKKENPEHSLDYSQKVDTWSNLGYGFIASAAVVYIYNIIDGAVSPGVSHIRVGKCNRSISFVPSCDNDGTCTLSLLYQF